ncbi:MAG: hypothetical protein A2381_02565 [Bdellovibrionales bacterium RIFOXYB1_FULL_37_110]|nr:MAG: hypothetical protein A2417_00030 [Bdellovibrionales bacterium RIFOXYC1_FULL_37_79]OFZ60893.1 MAG: hypothetical protein A2381_02565 [Bdellovibrionales bacterium RIFOXYB1_FULL_37_110]
MVGQPKPLTNVSYVSVFTIHFLNAPAENYGILRKLYIDLGLSMRDIAELTESAWPKTSILEAVKQCQINKPKSLESLRQKYGVRLVRGKLVSHEKEQSVIKLILKLSGEGWWQRQIAKHLNDKNIKSKTGGRWDKSVVTAIIKRESREEQA